MRRGLAAAVVLGAATMLVADTGWSWGSSVPKVSWRLLSGTAKDIGGTGATGTVLVGTNDQAYRQSGAGWASAGGVVNNIDAGSDGVLWVTNAQGNVYKNAGSGWQGIAGCAKDIGVGGNNQVWVIGCDAVPGGYSIYKFNGSGWDKAAGGAKRIDVDGSGNPWIVNDGGAIFRLVNGGWQGVTGCASDIGVGKNGSVFITGCGAVAGGYGIFGWNGSGWTEVGGGAVRISVDEQGRPWVVNDKGSIFIGDLSAEGTSAVSASPPTGPSLRSGELAGINIDGANRSCNYQETSPGTFRVTCGSAIKLENLTGKLNSSTDFDLRTRANNVKDALPGIGGIVDLVDSQLFNGINSADVSLKGPQNGSQVSVSTTVTLGSAFDDLDQFVQGTFGRSLKSLSVPVTATASQAGTQATANLFEGNSEFTVPETGTALQLRKLWVTYDNRAPVKIMVATNSSIRLSSADGWAGLDIKVGKNGATLLPSGVLTNLGKPFGVVPLTVTRATYEGRLKQVGSKKVMKAMKVTVEDGRLFDRYKLAGSFEVDTEAKKLAFDINYRMCAQSNRLAFDSTSPDQIPKMAADVVANLGKSIDACFKNASCPAGHEKGGLLCYPVCKAGFSSDGATLCKSACPGGYREEPLTCMRDAVSKTKQELNGKICGGGCPGGWRDDGCFCFRDAHSVSRETYSRGAGVPLVFPAD